MCVIGNEYMEHETFVLYLISILIMLTSILGELRTSFYAGAIPSYNSAFRCMSRPVPSTSPGPPKGQLVVASARWVGPKSVDHIHSAHLSTSSRPFRA